MAITLNIHSKKHRIFKNKNNFKKVKKCYLSSGFYFLLHKQMTKMPHNENRKN